MSVTNSSNSKMPKIADKVNDTNIFLANCISIFHIVIILFVLIAPFTNMISLLILHVVFCLSLLVHWIGNNNTCSLSYFESKLRGMDYTESFSHKFIGPIYDISNTSWSNMCYIITIFLMILSIYLIYKSEEPRLAYQKYKNICEIIKQNPGAFTISDRLKMYMLCFTDLLKI